MSSGISSIFVHVINTSDIKTTDEVTKQKLKLRDLVQDAANHLKNCQYNQAKIIFVEAKEFLKTCKKRSEMSLPPEFDFFLSTVICYSFTMELENIKDVTKEDFKKEDQSIKKEIDDLVKKFPKRHFPLFLRLLYSFKKECWREAIYYCEIVKNFKVSTEEEEKYKNTTIIKLHIPLIPELDIDYCNDAVRNIEEAAIYGLVEKVAKLDEVKNSSTAIPGFNWVNLWSKDFNNKMIKRLRSYKKPMSPFHLHKLFHSEVLPRFYTLNKSLEKSMFCYYRKEFMYQCEECLRAKLQLESQKEILRRICNHVSDDDDDIDYLDEDDDDDYLDSDEDVEPPADLSQNLKKDNGEDSKLELKVAEKDDGAKSNTKKILKSQQCQTEKVKTGNKNVQTECTTRKRSIAIQADVPKAKKQEKIEKQEEIKCTKCTNNPKIFTILEEIKNQLSTSKTDMKEIIKEQLAALLVEIKTNNVNVKNNNGKEVDKKDIEIRHSKENVAKLEKQILLMQEKFDKEQKDLTEKNVFLQKILLDQINDKYNLYKNTYSGLENNCRVIIANITEIQDFVTQNTTPNAKDNQSYLKRWEKTLADLQNKNVILKAFYKKTKSQMVKLNQYEFSDWPELAEIPIEAFGFLLDSLKKNVKNAAGFGSHQKPPNQNFINPKNIHPVLKPTVPITDGYGRPVLPQNIRPFIGTGLRYNSYQQPPPPIPMPPPKNPNNYQYLPPWAQNVNPNAQMYAASNQWNPGMTAFFNNFTSTANTDANNQKQTVNTANGASFDQNRPSSNPGNQELNIEQADMKLINKIWNVDSINPSLNKINEPNRSNQSFFNEVSKGNQHKNKNKSDEANENVKVNKSDQNFSKEAATNELQFREKIIADEILDHQAVMEELQREKTVQDGLWDVKCTSQEAYAAKVSKNTGNLVTTESEQELFQYFKSNCSDVDEGELIANILKVLKKYNGSFNNVPKIDLLKEIKSSILTTKHGVWISPKSPLVDWTTDHADTQCSICFDDLTQRPKRVLPCKHEYHKDCISQWLKNNNVCPICRVHSVIDEEFPPLS